MEFQGTPTELQGPSPEFLEKENEMNKTLDLKGKACPIPVIETKKVLETLNEGDTVDVTVDNFIAVQNLNKLANSMKYNFSYEKVNEDNYLAKFVSTNISNTKNVESDVEIECNIDSKSNIVVVLASDKMGEGDEKLGHTLMKGFIYALTEQDILPKTVLLYNNGAKLSVEGSDSLADLKLLESQGVEILTCGTCLNFYGISDKLSVGSVTNMYVIAEKQMLSEKIVRP